MVGVLLFKSDLNKFKYSKTTFYSSVFIKVILQGWYKMHLKKILMVNKPTNTKLDWKNSIKKLEQG